MRKPGAPFRPIISTINSTTTELSRYLKKITKPLTGKEPSFVKNSRILARELRDWPLASDEILISYDVKELFPSIPISHALKLLFDLLSKDDTLFDRTKLNPFHITKLTSFCMREGNYFHFDDKFYKQVNGAPMGSPVSPVLVEVLIESVE
ncbi:hypothetical protein M514_11808 [Trichuris suis]|uniref:Reverse transcriptase domain-containing protein n=1 Tax=Trichuris suis TaxID=68888 RepID=A0A085LQQ2_9BILA|nr:hypothetical protein M513_11808 [Trichuris suis]KFD64526.1 hypothetical protein M514_11808 [Trichuris suis]